MLCVVTGSAGFVGSTIVDRLLKDGHTVRGIDCFSDYYGREIKNRNIAGALNSDRFEFVDADIQHADLSELLCDAEWVFHQAGQAGVRASWGDSFPEYIEHNIHATQVLLEECVNHKSLKRFVYASSSSVYGNAESFPTSEIMLPQPVSPYGVTKLAGENLVSLYKTEYGVPTISLRYFTVYGPRQRPDMAFNRFARAGIKGEELTLFGDGTQSRDFTYISDIVDANILAAESSANGVFNIGGGTQATVNDVLAIMTKEIGRMRVVKMERQLGDAKHTSADTTKARKVLGFNPKVTLEEGIIHEITWMRSELGIAR